MRSRKSCAKAAVGPGRGLMKIYRYQKDDRCQRSSGRAHYTGVGLLVASIDALDTKWHFDRCVTRVEAMYLPSL